jgi:hypothetical protein
MKNERQTVFLRRYQDGKLVDTRVERRVVRTAKDGSLYVRGAMGNSPLTREADGTLSWSIHYTSCRATTFADLMAQIQKQRSAL